MNFQQSDESGSNLPAGTILIRDDDAANAGAPCWYSAQGDQEEVEASYEADGGTVSASYVIWLDQYRSGNFPGVMESRT
jgi:hypothetical protein